MPGGWEWLIIVGVLLLLFGAKRLPEMARSVGQSARVFKGEMKGLRDDDGRTTPGATPGAAPAQARPAAPGEPVALPPADDRAARPASGSSAGAGGQEPVRSDGVRSDGVRSDGVRSDTDR
jgi:sec-independent protein translocase protein TatA